MLVKMGSSTSRPAKYGTPGELGPMRGVAFSLAKSSAAPLPLLLSCGTLYVDQYNFESGDRRLRVKRNNGSLISATAFAPFSPFGFVMLCASTAGQVSLYAIDSLKEFKVVQTNGHPAGASDVRTTAVACFSSGTFFAGHSDGTVRAIQFTTGEIIRTFTPPKDAPMTDMSLPSDKRSSLSSPKRVDSAPMSAFAAAKSAPSPSPAGSGGATSEADTASLLGKAAASVVGSGATAVGASAAAAASIASNDNEVTSIALWGGQAPASAAAAAGAASSSLTQHMLAVGHRDGTIHCYSPGSGQWLIGFKTPPGLTQLLPLRRFNSLAALHEGKNLLQIWDLETDRSSVLDFTAELESINRRSSKMASTWFDEARGSEFFHAEQIASFAAAAVLLFVALSVHLSSLLFLFFLALPFPFPFHSFQSCCVVLTTALSSFVR